MTTAGMVLQDSFADIASRAVTMLSNSRTVLQLPPATRDSALSQVHSSLTGLHDIEISDVLRTALEMSRTLNTAARQSLATRTAQQVHINGYVIPIDYQPVLEVLVNEQRVATVHFRLRLTLELFNFDGVVERGRLVQLNSDALDVTAALAAEGQTLAMRKARLDLRFELPLPADGITLVRDA